MDDKPNIVFVEDLQLQYIMGTYTDRSGGRNNIPKRGDILVCDDKRYSVLEASTAPVFLDNGKTPFTVNVKLTKLK